ncbi:MAG: cyclic nucleotide-binding domain-containing protein [Pseudomonadota bacterium]
MSLLTAADIFVFGAALSYIIGYLIINQVVLRLFFLAGTTFYVIYYSVATETPLWAAIWTSVALGIANLIGLWILLSSRSRRALTPELVDLYDGFENFRSLPPGDFRAIVGAARRMNVEARTTILNEGAPNDMLYFLLSGTAETEKRGHRFSLPAGIFIGEVSYMLSEPAAATVTVDAGSEMLVWDFETLRKRSRRPRFRLALEAMVSRDLSRKVGHAVAPDDMRLPICRETA